MGRGSKESNEKSGQLTVADYTQRFLERTLENVLSDGDLREEKQRTAESNFLNLMHKLQEAGHKDDIRVPLRVLRDEIGSIHFHSASENRSDKIEVLFKLYDALERGAQEDARSKDSKVASAGSQLLEELRQRFSRLVVGDTWDAWPQLKLLALKRMHKYMLAERESEKDVASGSLPPTSSGRLGMRKLSRSISGISTSSVGSWSTTIDDLAKAPGTRLLPLIKLLLVDNEASAPQEQDLKPSTSLQSADSFKKRDSLTSRSSKPTLSTQPSGISEPAETARRISVLEMDDLLGLNEPSPVASTPDPFEVPNRAGGISGPPTPGQLQNNYSQGFYPKEAQSFSQTGVPSHNGQQVVAANAQPGVPPHHQAVNGTVAASQGQPLDTATSQSGIQQPGWASSRHLDVPARADSGLVSSSQPGSFNPFDLPSPTYSSRAPVTSDNNFADFSPVAKAPLAPPPAPMRVSSISPRHQNTTFGFNPTPK